MRGLITLVPPVGLPVVLRQLLEQPHQSSARLRLSAEQDPWPTRPRGASRASSSKVIDGPLPKWSRFPMLFRTLVQLRAASILATPIVSCNASFCGVHRRAAQDRWRGRIGLASPSHFCRRSEQARS